MYVGMSTKNIGFLIDPKNSSLIFNVLPKLYSPSMDGNNKLMWTGHSLKTIIQYSDKLKAYTLNNLYDLISGQKLGNDEENMLGIHEWKIFDDVGCTDEPFYLINISFR